MTSVKIVDEQTYDPFKWNLLWKIKNICDTIIGVFFLLNISVLKQITDISLTICL